MKITKYLFLAFLGMWVVGCASCVPGVCGCAFSIWPSRWEDGAQVPALIMEFVGFPGMIICGIVLLVLWTRRKTIADTARIRDEQDSKKELR